MWAVKWGPKSGQTVSDGEFLAKIAQKEGIVSSAIRDQPHLDIAEQWLWVGFQTLHMSRPSTGFGPGPIPLSEIVAYVELMQIAPGDDRQEFMQIMRTLDKTYLQQVTKK